MSRENFRGCTPGTNSGKHSHQLDLSAKVKTLMVYLSMHHRAKRRTLKQWDKQWGHIETEGNLWWLGSFRENWISVMGHSKWGWFRKLFLLTHLSFGTYAMSRVASVVPVGRTLIDGLHWVPNPRHDEEGRWRPRHEWPTALQ